jgi:hypothetical protein
VSGDTAIYGGGGGGGGLGRIRVNTLDGNFSPAPSAIITGSITNGVMLSN